MVARTGFVAAAALLALVVVGQASSSGWRRTGAGGRGAASVASSARSDLATLPVAARGPVSAAIGAGARAYRVEGRRKPWRSKQDAVSRTGRLSDRPMPSGRAG